MLFQTIANVFRISELRNKILFTLGMLAVYRIGFWIPLPGVNQEALARFFETASNTGSAAGRAAEFVAIFSGGSFSQSTIFGLGIMPYISAAIIFQLLQSVSPALKKLADEGPTGRQKIQEYTRYATVGLCVVQAFAWLSFITSAGEGLVYSQWSNNPVWWLMGVTALTAGTMFLMWLGEQIDRFGIGNGVSMIIMAGILTGMPGAVMWVIDNFEPGNTNKMGWMGLLMLLGGFVLIVGGSVLLTVAQRRIPVQQAKHTRGRRVFGGQRSYLPLRVNHGGVMPIIFASSIMIFPAVVLGYIADAAASGGANTGAWVSITRWLGDNFNMGGYLYTLAYILMVYFFAYFWITVQFNPEEMSKQLRDHGSFIPGLRPGPRTAEYLESVMERITYVGAAFLSIIAVLPMVVQSAMNIPFNVTQFLGGTGLLIVVSVSLDFLQRVEAALLMRNYQGFLGGEGGEKGPRLRSSRG
ncbi:MAG: preprotein translocase subunit SecY [Planctomycetota bacterium]